ncbi:hypothetical protein [Candidatus Pseudothioglobus sp. Uisw_016]|uniref:hypothetical protein n=1 Tax=Candidatus Pseudothioglobus sp. Uisw_016 TaxID=3230995 RepID=UPI003A83D093
MKKLLLLLFSLMLSFNSFAGEVCTSDWNQERNNVSVFIDGIVDVESDDLLSVCDEGDILIMSGFSYSSMQNSLFSSSRIALAQFMASYCDLSETQVIENQVLVCKLVDRDL